MHARTTVLRHSPGAVLPGPARHHGPVGGAATSIRPGAVFVIPDDAPPSGGNLYNRFLLRALSREGFPYEVMTMDDALDPPGPRRVPYWVDSLYFDRLESLLARTGPGQDVFLIVHQLRGLDDVLKPFRPSIRGFLATSPFTGDALRRKRRIGQAVFVVPPALCVRPPARRAARRNGFEGIMVANLVRSKGVLEFLIRLGLRLRDTDLFTLRIAGRADIEPRYAELCLREIESHRLLRERVRWLGPLSLARMTEEYGRSTVFVASSREETCGMALHEARAFGLPVLAVRAPYAEPFVNSGRTGYIYPSIEALVRGCLDVARAPRMLPRIRAGARRSRSLPAYSWSDAARSFLRQLADWRSGRPEAS